MFNKFLVLLFIFIFSSCIFAQQSKSKSNEQVVDVNYCDLLKKPSDYKNKLVRTTAIYTFGGVGFSQLYYPSCYKEIETSFRYDTDNQNCIPQSFKKTFSAKGLKSLKGKIIRVTIIGEIESKEFSGSLSSEQIQPNFYRNTFFVQIVEKAKLILNKGAVFSSLTEKDKAKLSRIIESKQN
ncbi:MAG: hypothetical protein M3367_14655 [Acidobacteriota bacterium]|nr:hypothetical protein [Acidobacteriota bacterium]